MDIILSDRGLTGIKKLGKFVGTGMLREYLFYSFYVVIFCINHGQ